jgi:beta-lactamase class A
MSNKIGNCKYNTKSIAKSILLFLSGFIMCYAIFVFNIPASHEPLGELRLPENFKFINPLLECDASISNFKQVTIIKEHVNKYISEQVSLSKIDSAAVYYRDLNNGPWFGINENTLFTPASLTKVPLMMTYYKQAEDHKLLLSKKLKVETTNFPKMLQTFNVPSTKLSNGKSYSIETLIWHMIIYSDNTAYLTLKNNLTDTEFHQIFEDFGIDTKTLKTSKSSDVLSIKEYSSFFRILYNSSYLNRELSEKALKILSESQFDKGLVSGTPGVVVSHKFGERYYDDSEEKQLHDCGIVYLEHNPYLICIMTRGNSFENLSSVIKDISAIVYSELKRQVK